jgi:hypothetical protein
MQAKTKPFPSADVSTCTASISLPFFLIFLGIDRFDTKLKRIEKEKKERNKEGRNCIISRLMNYKLK